MGKNKKLVNYIDQETLEYFEPFVSELKVDEEKLTYFRNIMKKDFGIQDIDDGMVYIGTLKARVFYYMIYSILLNYGDRGRNSSENFI